MVNGVHNALFDRELRTGGHISRLKLYTDAYADRTVVVCSEHADTSAFEQADITCWKLPELDGHLTQLNFIRVRASVVGVYLEAGPGLASALIEARAVDYVFHYIAPKYIADTQSAGMGRMRHTKHMDAAIQLSGVQHANFGSDHLVRGYL